jgi:hypothetical protein
MNTPVPSANDIQVGGTHYRNGFQHWDLAAECCLGYYEGQISKYITRHRFKKGREDAEKALHFAQKLLELAMAGKQPISAGVTHFRLYTFVHANKLLEREKDCIYRAVNWQHIADLQQLIEDIHGVIRLCYPAEVDDGEPTSGYVNQG